MIYAVSTIWRKHEGRGNCRRNSSDSSNGDWVHTGRDTNYAGLVVKLATCRILGLSNLRKHRDQ